jgi:hypothetical protein
VSKRWRDLIRSSDYVAFKAREGWCGDWLFVPSHNAGLDAEQKRTEKKERKMIIVVLVEWPCQITGMAVLCFWRERERRERGRKGKDKK